MPFLSLLDDRAKPKGSRDPLGFELVWSHFGRKVVGNLTTITGSIENFTVALLGFYWAHQLHENANIDNRERLIRETFLRYEQVAAYLRYVRVEGNNVIVKIKIAYPKKSYAPLIPIPGIGAIGVEEGLFWILQQEKWYYTGFVEWVAPLGPQD